MKGDQEKFADELEAKRREAARRERRKSLIRKALSLVGGVIGWYILSHTIFSRVPDPIVTASIIFFTVQDPWFYTSIIYSIGRVFTGFVIGTLLGLPVGLFMGWNRVFRDFSFPIFEAMRPIPPVAWVPLAILIFVKLTPSILFIIFWGTFYVVALNAKLGVEEIDQSLFRAAKCLGASPSRVLRHVVLPGALPAVFTGFSMAMGVAWITVVAAEMIAGEYGVGYMAWQSYNLIRYADVILSMITIGVLGYGSSAIIRMAGNKFLAWRKVYAQ